MSNGQREFLDAAELEEYMREAPDRELLELNVRQTFEVRAEVADHKKRITALEGKSHKTTGMWAGAGTFVGAAIVAVINFFTSRG